MKHALFFFFSFCYSFCIAQNLVPNPSFEDTTACPANMDGVSNLAYWFSARYSPDYFNVCAEEEAPYVSVPNNVCGYQIPLEGKAYTGLSTHCSGCPGIANYREILEVSLLQPLIVGLKYYVSTYISCAEAADKKTYCFANNFGFKFTNIQYSSIESAINGSPIDNFSHIRSITIITDTSDWVWVGGEFVADSAYQYLMLGNFYDDANTDTMCFRLPNSTVNMQAYYYIDNVCVSTDSTANRIPTGISILKKEAHEIYAFPNPAKNTLNIKNTQHYKAFILLNSLGQKVKEDKLAEGINTIDVGGYDRGIYFLLINGIATKILFIN